jgi:HD-like signal output (HDOD) protein
MTRTDHDELGLPPASIWEARPIRDALLLDVTHNLAAASTAEESSVLEGLRVALSRSALDFPPLPQPALRLLELWGNIDQLRHSSIINIIESDPALAGAVVKTANSPFFMVSSPATSLRTAVIRIGLNEVRRIVMAEAVGKSFRAPGFTKELEHIRRHGMLSAWMASQIAMEIDADGDTAFLGALLQDAGQLATFHMVQSCSQAGLWVRDEGLLVVGKGRELLIRMARRLHLGLGALFMDLWNLAPEVGSSIAYHHHPHLAEEKYRPLVELVHGAGLLADIALEHFRSDVWLEWLAEEDNDGMDDGIGDLPLAPVALVLGVKEAKLEDITRKVLVRFSTEW